jgi:hypothetical protein
LRFIVAAAAARRWGQGKASTTGREGPVVVAAAMDWVVEGRQGMKKSIRRRRKDMTVTKATKV